MPLSTKTMQNVHLKTPHFTVKPDIFLWSACMFLSNKICCLSSAAVRTTDCDILGKYLCVDPTDVAALEALVRQTTPAIYALPGHCPTWPWPIHLNCHTADRPRHWSAKVSADHTLDMTWGQYSRLTGWPVLIYIMIDIHVAQAWGRTVEIGVMGSIYRGGIQAQRNGCLGQSGGNNSGRWSRWRGRKGRGRDNGIVGWYYNS